MAIVLDRRWQSTVFGRSRGANRDGQSVEQERLVRISYYRRRRTLLHIPIVIYYLFGVRCWYRCCFFLSSAPMRSVCMRYEEAKVGSAAARKRARLASRSARARRPPGGGGKRREYKNMSIVYCIVSIVSTKTECMTIRKCIFHFSIAVLCAARCECVLSFPFGSFLSLLFLSLFRTIFIR